ncbi:MAG: hypothetical protein GPJ54_16840 [Candidatus Heimdallarchaeota archaeon]|nr:hypothetical protein [Candidatus Heimdallarchaeota archaeon]
MRQILISKSPVTIAVLSDTGEVQQLHENLDDLFTHAITELLENDPSSIITDSKKVSSFLNSKDIKTKIDMENKILSDWRINRFEHLLEKSGKSLSYEEYKVFIRNLAVKEARSEIKQAAGKRDELAGHIIQTIDDLQKTYNLNANRLYELYSLHFPELVDSISNPTTLARLITKYPARDMITKEVLDELKIDDEKITFVIESIDESLGGDYLEFDLEPIKTYAQVLIELSDQLKKLETWIDQEMISIAPNLTAVAGANVGARLISAFGSLRNLAMRSSSKIQTVGAEKAMYSALKKHGNPPKHGIIFQIPEVGNSPFWLRGKIARAYSGKIAIAARLDTFEGEFLGDKLRADLRELESNLREKFPTAPIKPHKESKKTHPMRRKRRRRSQR